MSPHALPLGSGSLLLLSGALECSIQVHGPNREPTSKLDWGSGTPLEEIVFPPRDPTGVLLLSARLGIAGRHRASDALPPVVVLEADRVRSNDWREPVIDSLRAELSHPRLGVCAIVDCLLKVLVIQGLRGELRAGAWRAPGWLGALTDPVLRTGFADAPTGSVPASVGALASEVHRSARRIRGRVKASSGTSPGRLLRQLRMDHALRRLEEGEARLDALARELGYAGVSSFCRAFRREVGCSPARYWRRVSGRQFPRRALTRRPSRHRMPENPRPLDSVAPDE